MFWTRWITEAHNFLYAEVATLRAELVALRKEFAMLKAKLTK
jgi:hypothetical protein